jgi:hypothetical protein
MSPMQLLANQTMRLIESFTINRNKLSIEVSLHRPDHISIYTVSVKNHAKTKDVLEAISHLNTITKLVKVHPSLQIQVSY